MTARSRALAFALVAVLGSLGARAASAAPSACSAPSVDADAAFAGRFPALLERLRSEVARPGIDTCARVHLFAADATTTRVSVTLPDGRAATRTAHRLDDVLPTLLALLLVPEAPGLLAAPDPPRPPQEAPPRPARRAATVSPTFRDRDTAAPPKLGPRTLGFELSLVGGPRMGGGQLAVGAGALSFLEAYGFLFGFQGRADRYQTLLNGDPELALELGLLAGKRVHFEGLALDFTAGPAVAMKGVVFGSTDVVAMNQDPVMAEASSLPRPRDDSALGPVPRLLLAARAGFTPRDVLRTFAGVEASIGPERGDQSVGTASGRFPTFTLGVVVGGTVGTR